MEEIHSITIHTVQFLEADPINQLDQGGLDIKFRF